MRTWQTVVVVAGAMFVAGCSAAAPSPREGVGDSHRRPESALTALRSASALVELDDVRREGEAWSATVARVYFDARRPRAVGVGDRIEFVLAERISADVLDTWHLALADITDGGMVPGPAYRLKLAVEPSGTAVLPEPLAAGARAVFRQLGASYSGAALGAALAEAARNPHDPPAALGPVRGDPTAGWESLPPRRRSLGDDSAPQAVLARRTVRTVLQLAIPAEIADTARSSDEPWLLRVVHPGLGVVYATEVSVGTHEFPVHLPAGTLEVELTTERLDRPDVSHVVGTVRAPAAETAAGVVRTATGPMRIGVAWATTRVAASEWDTANPLRLT